MDQLRNHKKLKASTLVETLTALTIVTIVFMAGMLIYNTTITSDQHPKMLRATQWVSQIALQTRMGDLEEFTDEENGVVLEKRVADYEGIEGLKLIEIIAKDNEDKTLFEHRELVKPIQQNEED